VFAADLGDSRDTNFPTEASYRPPSVDRDESSQHRPSGLRFRWSLAGALLAMAENVQAIRQILESNDHSLNSSG